MMHTVYILKCSDDSLYTGCTIDIKKRLHEHNTAKAGAKYTRGRRPVVLVYSKKFRTLAAGRRYEAEIKRLSRQEKLILIKQKNRA